MLKWVYFLNLYRNLYIVKMLLKDFLKSVKKWIIYLGLFLILVVGRVYCELNWLIEVGISIIFIYRLYIKR